MPVVLSRKALDVESHAERRSAIVVVPVSDPLLSSSAMAAAPMGAHARPARMPEGERSAERHPTISSSSRGPLRLVSREDADGSAPQVVARP